MDAGGDKFDDFTDLDAFGDETTAIASVGSSDCQYALTTESPNLTCILGTRQGFPSNPDSFSIDQKHGLIAVSSNEGQGVRIFGRNKTNNYSALKKCCILG